MFDTHKDLKKGDEVQFENVRQGDGSRLSGKGKVYGFGVFGYTELVWVVTEDGGYKAIPYENIIKV